MGKSERERKRSGKKTAHTHTHTVILPRILYNEYVYAYMYIYISYISLELSYVKNTDQHIEKINFIYKYTKDGGRKKTFPIPFFLYEFSDIRSCIQRKSFLGNSLTSLCHGKCRKRDRKNNAHTHTHTLTHTYTIHNTCM